MKNTPNGPFNREGSAQDCTSEKLFEMIPICLCGSFLIWRTCPENGVYERRWVRCFKRSSSQTREIKNPARSTTHLRFDFSGCLFYLYSAGITDCIISWGRSSAGRALEWHSRGRRFDPDRLHQTINNLDAIEILSVRKLSAFCPCSLIDWLLKVSLSSHPDSQGAFAVSP
jgi:hypothetical protein